MEKEKGEEIQQTESSLPYRYREPRTLEDLENMIRTCSEKICFVSSFFIQKAPGEQPEISEKDASGICHILEETEEDLDFVLGKIEEMQNKGLIVEIEKQEEAS